MKIKPKLIKNDDFGQSYEHPAFGAIQVSRISGERKLFGSALEKSNHFVRLSIHHAQKQRNFNQDSHFLRGSIVEVDLSTAQWGELLCSFNIGAGVPCTLARINNQGVEEIAASDESIQEEVTREFKDDCARVGNKLNELQEEFTKMMAKPTIPKKDKEEFLRKIANIKMEINSNLPFVTKQFIDTCEKIKTVAKHEMVAWVENNGIKASAPLLLE